MRGHHARIGWVELPGDPLFLAPGEDPIHPIGDDQEGAVVHLRDEVAKRDADRARQPYGLAVTPDGCKMTVRLRERIAITARGPLGNLRLGRAGQPGRTRSDEINEPINTFEHFSPQSSVSGPRSTILDLRTHNLRTLAPSYCTFAPSPIRTVGPVCSLPRFCPGNEQAGFFR